MKLAVSGKGGVGKTTVTSLLAQSFKKHNYKTFLIDADPDANLANALGFPPETQVKPLAELNELIKERVGAEPGKATVYFKLNPKVDDIPDRFCIQKNGVKLMAMGTIRRGGSGCACPENVLVKEFIAHMLIQRDEVVILDMEAGVEHLGRGTASHVDMLLVVVEATASSLQTFGRVKKLAGDLGMNNIGIIANRIRTPNDIQRITEDTGMPVLCALPYDECLIDYQGGDVSSQIQNEMNNLVSTLKHQTNKP